MYRFARIQVELDVENPRVVQSKYEKIWVKEISFNIALDEEAPYIANIWLRGKTVSKSGSEGKQDKTVYEGDLSTSAWVMGLVSTEAAAVLNKIETMKGNSKSRVDTASS